MPFLTSAQQQEYHEKGFLVVPNYMSVQQREQLMQAATKIMADWEPNTKIFSTDNQTSFLDQYFLESASNNSCFLEPDALKNGQLTVNKERAVNKIGHAMHDTLAAFETLSYRKNLLEITKDLDFEQPVMVQSQVVFKQAGIGEKVNAHTDSTFLKTTPHSCMGAWIALEDATIQNGCLQFIPGSHKWPLQQYYELNETNTGTQFIDTENPRLDWPLEKLIPVEVNAGDLVLLHGSVVHASGANHSPNSRKSYIMHIVDGRCEWSARNWLQRSPSLPFRQMADVIKGLYG